jgi:hypothetical protein
MATALGLQVLASLACAYKSASVTPFIGNWDVSKVTDMSDMFFYAASFNQAVGNWNVNKVTDIPDHR